MNKSTQKLVSALEELNQSRNDSTLDEIIDLARKEQFHDFQSPHTFSLMELGRRLKNIGYSDDDTIITRIKEGEFDATKEESQAWMNSPEGQDTLKELIGSAPAADPTTLPPHDHEGLWVRSEVMPDGTYGAALSVDSDRAWALNREVEHDTAVLRLLTSKLGIPDNDAAALLTQDLRPDRPDTHDATAPLCFTGAIGRARHPRPDAGAYIPLLMMALDGRQTGQLSPADLREHAAAVLNVLAAADLDAALYRVLLAKVGLDDATARAVVDSLAEYWPPRTEPRS